MRNLQLLCSDATETSIQDPVHLFVVDVLSQTIFIATSKELFSFSVANKKIINQTDIAEGVIVSIEHLADDELLSVATLSGDIYEWRYTEGSLECIATMDLGIACMSWSPDQDIVLLATGDGKLLLMSRTFDPLFETELDPTEFGEAQLITVGWGKKETQFHGKEGKPKAEDLKQKKAEPILPWDDKNVRIRWSEDGQYFALSSVDPETGSRKVRVRSRDGSLFSTSEVVQGLEHALDWKPNGNLVASSQRKPNKHDIVFLEKNGLMHGEFSLPFKTKEVKVKEICWNRTAEVLAIWIEDLKDPGGTAEEKSLSYVQLWTRNNYHWYLKQELRFSDAGLKISHILWDPEIPLKLHVMCCNGVLHEFTWHWTVSHSKDSCISVIDGANLKLTPFAKAVVPPPMSLMSAKLKAPVNQVCFANSSTHAYLVLSDGSLQFIKISDDEISPETVKIIFQNIEDDIQSAFNCFGMLDLVNWIDNFFIAVVRSIRKKDYVCLLRRTDNDAAEMLVCHVVALNKKVHSVAVNPDTSRVALQMQDGEIFTCEKEDDGITVKPWITCLGSPLWFPNSCEKMSVCSVNRKDFLIGMTDRYQLYIDDKQIAENCTSFAIHDEYLVYATFAHSLKCLLLDNLLKFLLGDEAVQPPAERSLERGSRIVAAVSQDTKVVLQMPRGNLETIHPRVLVVSFLKKQLDKLAYKKALVTMKRHRINLNLIHDHNPELFLKNVDVFLKDVSSENDICLFLADLIEEDVTRSLYSSCYGHSNKNETRAKSDKVDGICSAIRESIKRIGIERFFLSFLTSYVRQKVPDLEQVLIQTKKVKDKLIETSVTFDKALKHILYMTDVEELYNVALGLYDFDITLMIAEKSNKDPKEYLPFLNQLRECEESYCKFKIDCHLKRHRKALQHIFNCGQSHFEEFLDFVTTHGLYKEALDLCKDNRESVKSVSFLYGADLIKKRLHLEAGLVYSSAGFSDEALNCFTQCLEWKLALCEASKLQYSKEKLNKLTQSFTDKLKENKRCKEAGFLLEVYLEDFESAIMAYIEGHLWDESLRLIHRCERQDMIETDLIPAVLDAYSHCISNINDFKERFIQHKERLVIVRQLKEKQAFEIADGYKEEPENDLFSDTSSITGLSSITASSKGSRMTGHSSKSRRKSHRKKYSLKEGSRFEDFALMEVLAQIVNSVDKLQESIPSILRTLVIFCRKTEAGNLQKSFKECLDLIRGSMTDIWKVDQFDNGPKFTTGPQATVTAMVAEFVTKQHPDSAMPDLPKLTEPILRSDFKWELPLIP